MNKKENYLYIILFIALLVYYYIARKDKIANKVKASTNEVTQEVPLFLPE